MYIDLKDITTEGEEFVWTRKTGEANSTLKDLIGVQPYEARFHVRKLNNRDFDLGGTVVSASNEDCSHCGIDFQFPVNIKFHEILIPRQPEDRSGRYARVNHVSDSSESEVEVQEYDSEKFNMAEYLHEIIGLAIPFNPHPEIKEDNSCSLCGKSWGDELIYNDPMPETTKANPFEILKTFKKDDGVPERD